MSRSDLGLAWTAVWKGDGSWLRAQVPGLVATLAASSLWPKLVEIGSYQKQGRALQGLAHLARALRVPSTVVVSSATQRPADPDLRLTLSAQPTALHLSLHVFGNALAELGASAFDDVAMLIAQLSVRWRPHAALLRAEAVPFAAAPPDLAWTRPQPAQFVTPPRTMHAVVDIFDTEAAGASSDVVAGRLLAASVLPVAATRTETDGMVTIGFCRDLTDRVEVARACADHDAWLRSVLPTKRAADRNEHGDLLLFGADADAEPPFDRVLFTRYRNGQKVWSGLVFAETTEVPTCPQHALRDGTRLDEVNLVLPSRAEAQTVQGRALAAGFDRVLYRTGSGVLWDPFPMS